MRRGNMAKKDMVISQVHEFMVVSPDAKGGTNELAETTLHSSLGAPETLSDVRELPDENDPYAGPRSWVVKWFGPFFNVQSLPLQSSIILIAISIVITILGGLLPAKKAAKKDPVIALRTE